GRIGVETLDAGDFFLVDERELFDRAEAFRGKKLTDDFVEVERLHENLGTVFELGLTAFGFFLLRQDINVPAGKLRRKTHVLASTSDRQRQLLVRNDDLDTLLVFIQHNLCHFGRRKRIYDERGDIVRPRNDVDLLALQLVHHRLHARAAHADAGADGVD